MLGHEMQGDGLQKSERRPKFLLVLTIDLVFGPGSKSTANESAL